MGKLDHVSDVWQEWSMGIETQPFGDHWKKQVVEIGKGEEVTPWLTDYLKDSYVEKKIDFVVAPEDRPRSLDQALIST